MGESQCAIIYTSSVRRGFIIIIKLFSCFSFAMHPPLTHCFLLSRPAQLQLVNESKLEEGLDGHFLNQRSAQPTLEIYYCFLFRPQERGMDSSVRFLLLDCYFNCSLSNSTPLFLIPEMLHKNVSALGRKKGAK